MKLTWGIVDKDGERNVNFNSSLLGGRPMVGLQTLDLAIGVRVPASQPKLPLPHTIQRYQIDIILAQWKFLDEGSRLFYCDPHG